MKFYTLLITVIFTMQTWAVEVVNVGVYDFPPYVFTGEETTGIAIDIINEMNRIQDEYEFVAVPTTAKRRYSDFEKNKFDLILFENKQWGWQSYPVVASQVFGSSYEVYVTKAETGKTQAFFSNFSDKAMIGVLGYHYQFTGMQAQNEDKLNVFLTNSQKNSLGLILNDRGDITVLSMEYLYYHFTHYPDDKNKLLISDKFDQIYQHTMLVRRDNRLTVQYINTLIDNMKTKGALRLIWQSYGLDDPN
ncbi:transporter substrate-binding domain-containing protein [Psychrosphaera sp. F3M07]|uniref:substrate-binding periplasmic protein n=1 Tax=Psychrosphaera sp. F3M07 TaxID=2841560 RepID=UPI001C08FF33|nr:transporter substrate-binding domain-containing protein [Psychrosphaera sp. F3M07]